MNGIVHNACLYPRSSLDCCTEDGDCEDGNGCTANRCERQECVQEIVPDCCLGHDDCDDKNHCTRNFCKPYALHCTGVIIENCCMDNTQCKSDEKCVDHTCKRIPPGNACITHDDCSTEDLCVVGLCNGPSGYKECLYEYQSLCCDANLRLLLVEGNLFDNIQPELEQLAQDWAAEGACVKMLPLQSDAHPVSIRQLLVQHALQADLEGAFLLGNIPGRVFEFQRGGKPNSCTVDQYYADLDGLWSDSSGNGIIDYYDPTEGDTFGMGPDIVIGRIVVPSVIAFGTETEAVRNYLRKVHDYRYAGPRIGGGNGMALVFSGYVSVYIENDVLSIMKLVPDPVVFDPDVKCSSSYLGPHLTVRHTWDGTAAVLLKDLQNRYEWVVIVGHGSSRNVHLYGNDQLTGGDVDHHLISKARFMAFQWCRSGKLFDNDGGEDEEGGYVVMDSASRVVSDSLAARFLLLKPHFGLAAIGHAAFGLTQCQLGVQYGSLAAGASVGQAVNDRLRRVAEDRAMGTLCNNWEKLHEYSVGIVGDPFLRPYPLP